MLMKKYSWAPEIDGSGSDVEDDEDSYAPGYPNFCASSEPEKWAPWLPSDHNDVDDEPTSEND